MNHSIVTARSPQPRLRMQRHAAGRSTPRPGMRRPAGRTCGAAHGGMVCLLAGAAAERSSRSVDEATDWLAAVVAELDREQPGAAG